MPRILIVDDMAVFREPIAAIFRQEGYETIVAADGCEALTVVSEQHPDMLLLDVAMPVMGGMECLKILRAHPQTRQIPVIMLTALSDRELVKEAAQLGVQGYLLKADFSTGELLARVQKLLGAPGAATGPAQLPRRVSGPPLSDPKRDCDNEAPGSGPKNKADVLKRIRQQGDLETVPAVLQAVLAMSNSRDSSIADVANAIRKDQAMAVKVMRVANSSFYGKGKQVQSITEAAHRVGMLGIRGCVAALATIDHFASARIGGLSPQRFWEHSLSTAFLVEPIGRSAGLQNQEELFLAGLLHDIGRLILAIAFPDDYQAILASSVQPRIDLVSAERKLFGLTHADITKEVLTKWTMPGHIVEAASQHESTVEQIRRASRDPEATLTVALANRLAHAAALGDSGNAMLLPFQDYAAALGLTGKTVWTITQDAIEKTKDTLLSYTAQSDQKFRDPLATELARRAEQPVKAAILASDAPGDPLSLLLAQLGWLDQAEPNLAILYVGEEGELPKRLRELQALEASLEGHLPLLVVSPDGSVTPPPDVLQDRACATAQVPGWYDAIIQTIVSLTGNLIPETASTHL